MKRIDDFATFEYQLKDIKPKTIDNELIYSAYSANLTCLGKIELGIKPCPKFPIQELYISKNPKSSFYILSLSVKDMISIFRDQRNFDNPDTLFKYNKFLCNIYIVFNNGDYIEKFSTIVNGNQCENVQVTKLLETNRGLISDIYRSNYDEEPKMTSIRFAFTDLLECNFTSSKFMEINGNFAYYEYTRKTIVDTNPKQISVFTIYRTDDKEKLVKIEDRFNINEKSHKISIYIDNGYFLREDDDYNSDEPRFASISLDIGNDNINNIPFIINKDEQSSVDNIVDDINDPKNEKAVINILEKLATCIEPVHFSFQI